MPSKVPFNEEGSQATVKLGTKNGNLRGHLSNRPFSKMAAETDSNKSKLKTYTSTRKKTSSLVKLQSFSFSGVISAEKM